MECNYKDKLKVLKIEGKLHSKILLDYDNFDNHIRIRHPEMTINIIEEILKEPDYIYKQSKSSSVYYYEKIFGEDTYRVVIQKQRIHVKEVVTAYKVGVEDEFSIKHVYCAYDKETFVDYEDINKELENDIDYFYEVFNIAE